MSTKAKGTITASRTRCTDRDDYMSFEIHDKDRRRVVEVDIGFAEFMEAITGLADRPCEFVSRAVCPEVEANEL